MFSSVPPGWLDKLMDQALFLTHNDVDTTGKSYYGETNLYLVSLDGSYDGLVDLGQLSSPASPVRIS